MNTGPKKPRPSGRGAVTELTLEMLREVLREELTPIRDELKTMRADIKALQAHVDGIPFIHRKVDTILQEQRMLRSALNDLARIQVTAGEIEALHHDVNQVQTKIGELEVQIATLERTKQDKE